ncbi:hypothetical protein CTM67_16515 [Photobacterium phosphoreum]|nr:hypothetical protein CTM67_16515 [Photobacterium phosphoreum]
MLGIADQRVGGSLILEPSSLLITIKKTVSKDAVFFRLYKMDSSLDDQRVGDSLSTINTNDNKIMT